MEKKNKLVERFKLARIYESFSGAAASILYKLTQVGCSLGTLREQRPGWEIPKLRRKHKG